jgi:hypothetical protein
MTDPQGTPTSDEHPLTVGPDRQVDPFFHRGRRARYTRHLARPGRVVHSIDLEIAR